MVDHDPSLLKHDFEDLSRAPFISSARFLILFSCGICSHSNPSFFGTAVKHFDLFAIDAELEDKNRNRIACIIVVYNSYDHIVSLPMLISSYYHHNSLGITREYLKKGYCLFGDGHHKRCY